MIWIILAGAFIMLGATGVLSFAWDALTRGCDQ